MIKERVKKCKQANFAIPMELYQKFRLIAATKGISIRKLYAQAAEEFCSKFKESRLISE